MSLDVYLYGPAETTKCVCECCEDEHTKTLCPCVFHRNITHNLGRMAGLAGLYQPLWRPDEIDCKTAGQLIGPMRAGLAMLRSDEPRFRALDAPNGWGRYEHLVAFVEAYLAACEEHPTATVGVSR
jgi:hypothetical protein